jgi:hypothetical protein
MGRTTRLEPQWADVPRRFWATALLAAALAFAFGVGVTANRDVVALVAMFAAPVLVSILPRYAGPRAGVAAGIAMAAAAFGVALLAAPQMSATVGSELRVRAPLFDHALASGGAWLGILTYSGLFLGLFLARDRGASIDRVVRLGAALLAFSGGALAGAGYLGTRGATDKRTWLATLVPDDGSTVPDSSQMGSILEHRRNAAIAGSLCGSSSVATSRRGTLTLERDPARGVLLWICEERADYFVGPERLLWFERVPPQPSRFDPLTDPRGLRFAPPRPWTQRSLLGFVVAVVWVGGAWWLRRRALRSLTVMRDAEHLGEGRVRWADGGESRVDDPTNLPIGPVLVSHPDELPATTFRATAAPLPRSSVLPSSREAMTRSIEGRFTGACVAAAALSIAVCAPLAMA